MIKNDIKFIRKALQEAEKAIAISSPNPPVGCIIVKNNKIIGRGHTQRVGFDHAEIQAIKSAEKKGFSIAGSTFYITLEPCSHYGRTPPCAKILIEKKISRAVISLKDPNPIVNGKGIAMLKNAGIEVSLGYEKEKAKFLIRFYLKNTKYGLPYLSIKTAQTLDGNIATSTGNSKWITSENSRKEVHRLRNVYNAILTSSTTIKADNPMLNVRLVKKISDPTRVIIDRDGLLNTKDRVIRTADIQRTIIITQKKIIKSIKTLNPKLEVVSLPLKNRHFVWKNILKLLYKMGIYSILTEAGGSMNYSMLTNNIVDDIYLFIAPKIIGGKKSIHSFAGKGIIKMKDAIDLNIQDIKFIKPDIMILAQIKT